MNKQTFREHYPYEFHKEFYTNFYLGQEPDYGIGFMHDASTAIDWDSYLAHNYVELPKAEDEMPILTAKEWFRLKRLGVTDWQLKGLHEITNGMKQGKSYDWNEETFTVINPDEAKKNHTRDMLRQQMRYIPRSEKRREFITWMIIENKLQEKKKLAKSGLNARKEAKLIRRRIKALEAELQEMREAIPA